MEFLFLTKSMTPVISWFADILGIIMDIIFKMTSSIGILNIGVGIILFTVIINLLMIPLTIKQQKSSKLMSVIQPEIKAIQDKYKGKSDNDSMMRMQAETRAVYEKYGTSMTGGCLPLLIQMPILFGLYQVIYRIPAYVSSVRVYFENIATVLMQQDGYIDKISGLADTAKLPIASNDYTIVNKVIDLLYKFTPDNWSELGLLFPNMSDILSSNVPAIESMNNFLGINLATAPWQGFVPTLAWIIPVLAGLSQWYSTKLMTRNQSQMGGDDSQMAQQMKTMNNIMPLMSVYFCFIFPVGIGIYWIASAVVRSITQILINNHLDKIDIDQMVEENIKKSNEKRAKKGLPPVSASKKVLDHARLQNDDSMVQINEEKAQKKKEINAKHIKDSTEYYNMDAKPGSLAAKANMVAKYNERQSNKKKNQGQEIGQE